MLSQVGPGEITIATVAKSLGITRRTLDREFRRETGLAVAEWRKRSRLIESMRLVLAGVPIEEIAFRVGYCDRQASSRAFERHYAFTKFRQMYGV